MDVKRLAERLTREARITVLTGAGVSAASGVPTFRGADGLWRNFRPEALATAEASNPEATPVTGGVDLVLRGPAETILPAIAASL